MWIFGGFAIAFLVKMPLVPFHGWLPDGYKAMPIPAVAVFSGILSKVAAYGFLRIVLPLFPYASVHFQTLMLIIALVSVLWGTVIAMTTPDARLVVAYSSVAQLGFIVLGIFTLTPQGAQGALIQMANHALVTVPLFFIVAAAAMRSSGSEKLADMGGIAFRAPVLATLALIVTLANLAMPGSSNFIGEFNILLGLFNSKLPIAMIASLGVVGAAAYALRLYIRAMHNRVGAEGDLVRDQALGGGRDRADGAADPRVRVLPAVRAEAVAVGGHAPRSPPRTAHTGALASTHHRRPPPPAMQDQMTLALATAHLHGPHIDWGSFMPIADPRRRRADRAGRRPARRSPGRAHPRPGHRAASRSWRSRRRWWSRSATSTIRPRSSRPRCGSTICR